MSSASTSPGLGSTRRELLDHVIVLGEAHARQLLCTYVLPHE